MEFGNEGESREEHQGRKGFAGGSKGITSKFWAMWIALLWFFVVPLVVTLAVLGILSLVIKTPTVRIFVLISCVILSDFGVFGFPSGWLSQLAGSDPGWRSQQFTFKRHLEQIYPALVSYKKDHEGTFPEHLSQLVPGYIPLKDLRFFDNSHPPGLFRPIALKEIDRYGAFEYFGGNRSGMLAASRKPIEKDWWTIGWNRRFHMVLDADGKVESVSESEYQRRLKGGEGLKMP